MEPIILNFELEKKTDFIKLWFNTSVSKLDISNEYIINSKENNSRLILKLKKTLEPLFNSGEIYLIEHRNDTLRIELRTENHHFDIFDEISNL